MTYYTYILASRRNGTLYVGMARDSMNRIAAHKQDLVKGFTKKYQVHTLVWYEQHESKEAALIREKRLKKWKRAWKIRLIEELNPGWSDLYDQMVEKVPGSLPPQGWKN